MKISAEQLELFASTTIAKGLLPELVRRLIRASAVRVEDVLFPSGESTFRPGADGLLRAVGCAPYVPSDVSIWEVSTERNPHVKARRDIEKRNHASSQSSYLGTARSEIIYVALSMRRWHGERKQSREGFEQEQRQLGIWRDVKIFDADHLEDWLDRCPSVRAWLGPQMHLASGDMLSIEDVWEDYRNGVSRPMSKELLLLSRQEKAEQLIQAAVQNESVRVKADSPKEAVAFVAASILSLPVEDARREALLAKAVVITRPESHAFLRDAHEKLLIVVSELATDIASRLAADGHTVVAAFGNSHSARRGNSPLLDLRRPRRHEFIEALQAMGMDETEARRTTASCHCSITVFHRIGDIYHSRNPDWASPAQLRKLLGPMLCGAWLHQSDADIGIVADVAGVSGEEMEANVVDVLHLDDAPIRREGDLTVLSAPADLWQLGIEKGIVTWQSLERFKHAATKVLGEIDPSLDLPIDRRAYADLEGKKLRYSGALRRGIAEILRLIAINDQALMSPGSGYSAQQFVDGIISDLPGLSIDHRLFASLDSLLPDLAEASPDPFLNALEALSAGDGKLLSPIFEGSDEAFFGKTYYLGVLRGLEVLAWDPALLHRVAGLLAVLAKIDPGGRLSNRPITSLTYIFLPWKPHTNASQELRHQVLRRICSDSPEVAWSLLSSLLPEARSISFGTSEPQWREMEVSHRPMPTQQSAALDWNLAIELAAPLARGNADRWIKLITAASYLPDPSRLDLLLQQIVVDQSALSASGADVLLWEGLNELVSKHRAFASANWAMPSAAVDKIARLAEGFVPHDPVSAHRALFNAYADEAEFAGEKFELRRERLEAKRDAVIERLAKDGVEGLVNLAKQVKNAGLMAAPLLRVCGEEQLRAFVLSSSLAQEPLPWLAGRVVASGVGKYGFEWGTGLISQLQLIGLGEMHLGTMLAEWGDSRDLLDFVASTSQATQAAYWGSRNVYIHGDDERLVSEIIVGLTENGRSVELIQSVGSRRSEIGAELLLTVITRAFEEVVREPHKIGMLDRSALRDVFDCLRQRRDIDRDTLMSLEYRWFPALHSYGEDQAYALHEYMGERPEFFVEVLSHLYRSDAELSSDGDSASEAGEQEDKEDSDAGIRERADIAYKILDSWRTLPGTSSDGSIDEDTMFAWVRKAWQLAQEVGRLGVAEREVGKLLAYSSVDRGDGLWPHLSVRNLIEEVRSSEMESALVIELFNKRGVHTRSRDGGGEQERELARDASELAAKLQGNWPRTAQVLRARAADWIYHAELEDKWAAEQRISL